MNRRDFFTGVLGGLALMTSGNPAPRARMPIRRPLPPLPSRPRGRHIKKVVLVSFSLTKYSDSPFHG